MTDKRPHIVKIKGKGTDGLGITEDLARQMCLPSSKGKCYMAVVEVMVDWIHDGREQKVSDLAIQQFWPATDDELDEHLRELTRVLHQNKALASEDQELPIENKDDLAPKVADVLAEGAKHLPHEFDVDPDDPESCLICGGDDYADVHQTIEPGDDEDGDQVDDDASEPDADPGDDDSDDDSDPDADEHPADPFTVPDNQDQDDLVTT